MRRLLATGVALGALLLPSGAAGAASKGPCDLLTKKELAKALDVKFEVLFTESSLCSWASVVDAPPVGVDLVVTELPEKTIEEGKKFEREQPDARVLRGLGDHAVFSTITMSVDSPTSQLVIFEGNEVVQLSVTDSRSAATPGQLRRLGARALSRL